jgi:hypothetical protein
LSIVNGNGAGRVSLSGGSLSIGPAGQHPTTDLEVKVVDQRGCTATARIHITYSDTAGTAVHDGQSVSVTGGTVDLPAECGSDSTCDFHLALAGPVSSATNCRPISIQPSKITASRGHLSSVPLMITGGTGPYQLSIVNGNGTGGVSVSEGSVSISAPGQYPTTQIEVQAVDRFGCVGQTTIMITYPLSRDSRFGGMLASFGSTDDGSIGAPTATIARARRPRHRRTPTLGSGTGHLTAGSSGAIRLTLTRAAVALLSRRSIAVILAGYERQGGAVTPIRVKLTLVRKHH